MVKKAHYDVKYVQRFYVLSFISLSGQKGWLETNGLNYHEIYKSLITPKIEPIVTIVGVACHEILIQPIVSNCFKEKIDVLIFIHSQCLYWLEEKWRLQIFVFVFGVQLRGRSFFNRFIHSGEAIALLGTAKTLTPAIP